MACVNGENVNLSPYVWQFEEVLEPFLYRNIPDPYDADVRRVTVTESELDMIYTRVTNTAEFRKLKSGYEILTNTGYLYFKRVKDLYEVYGYTWKSLKKGS